jgi:glycosyltransferase 2 family protein
VSLFRRVFLDWKAIAGLLLSAGLLWFAFRGVHLSEVVSELRRADLLLFLLAVTVGTFAFAVRAVRWRYLLDAVRTGTSFRSRFAATTIGFMANNLLPARVGEFVRAYSFGRMERVPLVASFGSLVVERTLDGLTVVAFLFMALAAPAFPEVSLVGGRDVSGIATMLAVVFGGFAVLLLVLVLLPERSVALFESTFARLLPRQVRRPLLDALRAFLVGLGALRRLSLLLPAVLWSLALWLVGALSFWLGFMAFGIDLPFTAAVFLQSLIALAVALPSAPGFFGVFEAAARVGLVDLWGVDTGPALGFAVGFHIGGFIPVTVIGLVYAWQFGLTLKDVEQSEEEVETAVERDEPIDPSAQERVS